MVLSSQMARAGTGRRHMTSRRRKKSSLRWALPVLVITVILVVWLWPDTESASSAGPSGPSTSTMPDASVSKQPLSTPKPANIAPPTKRTPILNDRTTSRATSLASTTDEKTPSPPNQSNPQTTDTLRRPPSTAANAVSGLPPRTTDRPTHETAGQMGRAMGLIEDGQLIEARGVLNTLLATPNAPRSQAIRSKLAQVNDILVFSSRMIPDDPLVLAHTIQAGELLSTIAPRYRIPYQLIEHINGISARRIRLGQTLKVIQGPFHAIVHKADYRMDVYLNGSGGEPIYIRSFTVGLGEDNSTPTGSWIARRGGKVANPGWTNPRTGQVFLPDDPQNPIGEYWIGLEGHDDHTRGLVGYGIHGTIEPDSIGQQVSMGCVRLRPDDIALVYKLLTDGQSTVVIRP